MINEHTYYIGMTFISWVVAIFMMNGYIFLIEVKREVKKESTDDAEKLVYESFLNRFEGFNFPEKVLSIMFYGATVTATMFMNIVNSIKKIFRKKE